MYFVRLTGEHVTDLVHLYGLARAGYVPELFSLKFSLPGQAVVCDLLQECDGKALVYDAHFHDIVNEINLPKFPLVDITALPDASDALQPLPDASAEDPAIIFHTSGTTGGRPKPVPQSHKWCIAHAKYCWNGAWQGKYDTQDVVNNIGSFAHMGASTCTFFLTRSYATTKLAPTFRYIQVRVHRSGLCAHISCRDWRRLVPCDGQAMWVEPVVAIFDMAVRVN